MMEIVSAHFVFSRRDNDMVIVGFADNEFETKEYVLLQKSLTYDENDIKLGFHEVSITINDQIKSAYGGIKQIIVQPQKVRIHLKSDTAEKLRTDHTIDIVLAKEMSISQKVVEDLKYMFKMSPEIIIDMIPK